MKRETGAWLAAMGMAWAVHLALLGGLALLPTRSNARAPETSISIVAPPSAGFASNLTEFTRVAAQPAEPVSAARAVSSSALPAVDAAGDRLERVAPENAAPPVGPSAQPASAPQPAHVAPAEGSTRQTAANDPAMLASPDIASAAPAAADPVQPESAARQTALQPREIARAEAPASTPAAPVERPDQREAPANDASRLGSRSDASTPSAVPATPTAQPETPARETAQRPQAAARPQTAGPTQLPAAWVEALTPPTRVAPRSASAPAGPSTASRVTPEAPAAEAPAIVARRTPPAPATPAAPLMPSQPSRVAPAGPGSVTTAAPPSPVQRPAGDLRVATLAPTRNQPSAPQESADEYRRVLDFLRRYEGGGCFVALPSLRAGSRLGLDGFTSDTDSLASFAEEFSRATGVSADAHLDAVSLAQCRALTFAQNLASYPAFSLRIELEQRRLRSGERLRGTVREVGNRTAHLLLVDDEGKVQRADGFLSRSGADATFGAHMTLTGGPVATVQLLVALAAQERLETIERLDGEDAQLFFAELAEEIAERGLAVDLAIASFSVR